MSDNDGRSATHETYYQGFVAALIVCLSPLKLVAYLVPWLFVFWHLLQTPTRDLVRRLANLCAVLGLVAIFYSIAAPEFLLGNYVLAAVTYSAFVPLLVIDTRALGSKPLFVRMLRVTTTALLVEGVVGIIQAVHAATQTGSFGGSNGDWVAGTLYPHLHAELAFSNPTFAVNVSLMLLVSLAHRELIDTRGKTSLILAAIALVLASVVHVLVFLVASSAIAFVITRPPSRLSSVARGSRRRLALTVVLISALSYFAMPRNIENIESVAQRAFDLEALDIPRAIMLNRVFTELPDAAPRQPFIGLGPGQFCSRASLMASGLHFGNDSSKKVPLLPQQATALARDYCSVITPFADAEITIGSSQQPFFSWLSVYTELGILGFALVILVLWRLTARVRERAREHPELQFHALLFCTATIFVFLLGWQENYWETPQAIFVGLLLLKVLYAVILYGPVPATTQR